jgi:hypothetical protein
LALLVCFVSLSFLAVAPLSEVAADCPTTAVAAQAGATSTFLRAPSANARFGRSVYLITPAEMAASGIPTGPVSGIGWTYTVGAGVAASAPLKVYLQQTTDTVNNKSTTWATAITGMTLVHDATTALPSTAGAFDITFTGGSPFSFTAGPGQGLYVAFDWGQYTGALSTTATVQCNSTVVAGPAPTTVANSNFRPETRLAVAAVDNDVSVDFLISMGAIPQSQLTAQTI